MEGKLIKILTGLGLDDKQAQAYLSLLELGQATVEDVARRSGIKRTSLYFILDNLKRIGLVFEIKLNRRTYFEAAKPDMALSIYKEKVDKLEASMADLSAMCNRRTFGTRVLFYDSEEGFKQIWRTVLNSGIGEYLILTDPKMMLDFVKKNYITNRVIKEKIKKGIKSRQLIFPSEYAKEITAKDREEGRISRLLPFDHRVYFTIIIFGQSVAFISPYRENIIFLVESEALAKTQTAIFENLWEHAKPI